MKTSLRLRRTGLVMAAIIGLAVFVLSNQEQWSVTSVPASSGVDAVREGSALEALAQLPVKGRAPKTGYQRAQFGSGWERRQGCDMRNIILARDLAETKVNDSCQVTAGRLQDPYTGSQIDFLRGDQTSQLVQIDHVVALSNAWQTGAQQIGASQRAMLANDPLNLLAVDGAANQEKSDGDAATWLPSNKSFRCQYVARQIAVKKKYALWVVPAEKEAMQRILHQCPLQTLPEE